ncbi:MAG: VOC family protein [Chloroflexi bacterium]|nr:VOC family protein [Chloroflexota bacterium]
MAKAVRHKLAHICILVKDVDQAIEHYRNILGAVAPQLLKKKIIKHESYSGQDKYVEAFFPAPGNACDIQLIQPVNPESPLYKRLEKYGEGFHHMAFTTSDLEDTAQRIKEKGIPYSGQFVSDKENPVLRWTWILPKGSNGVLIEVMDSYKVVNGKLAPDKD